MLLWRMTGFYRYWADRVQANSHRFCVSGKLAISGNRGHWGCWKSPFYRWMNGVIRMTLASLVG